MENKSFKLKSIKLLTEIAIKLKSRKIKKKIAIKTYQNV